MQDDISQYWQFSSVKNYYANSLKKTLKWGKKWFDEKRKENYQSRTWKSSSMLKIAKKLKRDHRTIERFSRMVVRCEKKQTKGNFVLWMIVKSEQSKLGCLENLMPPAKRFLRCYCKKCVQTNKMQSAKNRCISQKNRWKLPLDKKSHGIEKNMGIAIHEVWFFHSNIYWLLVKRMARKW